MITRSNHNCISHRRHLIRHLIESITAPIHAQTQINDSANLLRSIGSIVRDTILQQLLHTTEYTGRGTLTCTIEYLDRIDLGGLSSASFKACSDTGNVCPVIINGVFGIGSSTNVW